jgi:hypothetical protein
LAAPNKATCDDDVELANEMVKESSWKCLRGSGKRCKTVNGEYAGSVVERATALGQGDCSKPWQDSGSSLYFH